MATDSSASGFLSPSGLDPYDKALDRILQAAVVGITGLPGNLVRPRWQIEPPNQVAFDVDWCAFGVVRSPVDTYAYAEHVPDGGNGAGVSIIERDEELYTLHSFYGPNSRSNCERFRNGLFIDQNRDTLLAAGVVLTNVGEATILPALLQQKWVKRVDVMVVYRRRTSTQYSILTVQSGQVGLDNEIYVTPIIVNPQESS